MKADTRTLQEVLVGDRRFVVPIYQRPYVWDKERQWEPLWNDLEATARRLVDARISGFGKGHDIAVADKEASPHFLGAIVLEQSPTATGALETRIVVDGQQRLTTLQLLLKGVLDALNELDTDRVMRARMTKAVRNDETVGFEPGELLKITPRLAEVEAFASAMESDSPDPSASNFAAARDYFAEMARSFLRDEMIPADPYVADGESHASRGALLVASILGLMKLVVIDLDQVDDAQIIFEALNARNTPLSATDLVKNLLFLRAQAEHFDPEELYNKLWKRFDDDADWWLQTTGIGHAQRANQDWLLGDWLIAELGRSINVGRLYTEFRSWLDNSGLKAFDALSTLSIHADAYEVLNGRRPGLTAKEHLAYQRIDRLNITVATPLLLWLLVQPADILKPTDRELAFLAVESFVVRRMAAKWQTRAYGQVFVDVLAEAQKSLANPAYAVIESLHEGPNNYAWPSDEDVALAFADGRYYGPGGINQDRLRLIFGAIDECLQAEAKKPEAIEVDYDVLQVEHIIPQTWQDSWPIQVADPAERVVAELERAQHINRIGNLTLVSGSLNAAISNNPWEAKRAELQKYTKLELNRLLLLEEEWGETRISSRGRFLASIFNRVWPGPNNPQWNDPIVSVDFEEGASGAVSQHIDVGSDTPEAAVVMSDPDQVEPRILRSEGARSVPHEGWESRGSALMTCRVCGETKTTTKFPTINPARTGGRGQGLTGTASTNATRSTECRDCRDTRRSHENSNNQ